ncbi:hypothetical protein [Singulisphaera sp. PoT]|uniref:hypothetical protein n=1 Tax=Singulisphaera sp. PoT TaxID=3411797 RepID=UPI003BF4856D
MHHTRLNTGSLMLVVAACGVEIASLQGNHIWFSGLSLLTSIGLLIAAVGASSDANRPRPTSPGHFTAGRPI